MIEHFRDSARECSNRLRQRAGASAADGDMYSLFCEHETATAMVRSSMLVKKSAHVVPLQRASTRISPFVSDDANYEPHDAASDQVHHHHFVSGRSARSSLRHELPLAQSEEDGGEDALAITEASLDRPLTRTTTPPENYTGLRVSVDALAQDAPVAVSSGGTLPMVLTPTLKKQSLFVRQATIHFADLRSDAVLRTNDHDDDDQADNDDNRRQDDAACGNDTPHSMKANSEHIEQESSAAAVATPQRRNSPQSPTAVNEQKRNQYSVLSTSGTVRRDLQTMIDKLRSTTATPMAQQTIVAELLLLKGTYILHPQQPFIVSWQFVIGIAIMYSIVIVPLRLGFSYDAVGGWFVLELVMDGLFLFDIVLSFRTAFVNDEKMLIYNPRAIRRKYVSGWFVPDLISTIPFDDIVRCGRLANALVALLCGRVCLHWSHQRLTGVCVLRWTVLVVCSWERRTTKCTCSPRSCSD